MSSRRAFKNDESFLEKLSQGAAGTSKVFENLKKQCHSPIELERGSMGFKLWKKIKIKRVRVPDLLCVNCGRRIESRAKTDLQISMSHSTSDPKRGWDYGLLDEDYVAFVKAKKIGERPIDWGTDELVQYVKVADMREARMNSMVSEVKPKGATEGFEARLVWSSAIASGDGIVINIEKNCLRYRKRAEGRICRLSLKKGGHELKPLVKVGDSIVENQILASVVPVLRGISCSENLTKDYYIQLMKSASHSDKYVAAKALAYFPSSETNEALKERMNDEKEHIYIRLECACSLLKMNENESIRFFEQMLNSEYLEYQLECVIALSEVAKEEAADLLIKTLLDSQKNAEIRAGAAWSLGEMRSKNAITALVSAFDTVDKEVKIEAARAMVKLNDLFSEEIIKLLPEDSDSRKAGISWALSKSGNFSVHDLLEVMKDEDARKWIAWIIGTQKEQKFISQIEELKAKDHEVYFAVTVLWKVLSSWINGLEIY
jgi:hypothetical protein